MPIYDIINSKTDLFFINQKVYYIKNNKVKKGVITKINNEDIYVSRFKYCCFKTIVYPKYNCFLTKELATSSLREHLYESFRTF